MSILSFQWWYWNIYKLGRQCWFYIWMGNISSGCGYLLAFSSLIGRTNFPMSAFSWTLTCKLNDYGLLSDKIVDHSSILPTIYLKRINFREFREFCTNSRKYVFAKYLKVTNSRKFVFAKYLFNTNSRKFISEIIEYHGYYLARPSNSQKKGFVKVSKTPICENMHSRNISRRSIREIKYSRNISKRLIRENKYSRIVLFLTSRK